MNALPKLLFIATLGNILYLSMISVMSALVLPTSLVIVLRTLAILLCAWFLRRYLGDMNAKWDLRLLFVFLPYVIIALLRFPLLYPTYDDLAVHYMWGDYANRLWQSRNFMPLEFLNYFYLPYDMNYTPLLYFIGIRLTIWTFFALTTVWMASLYLRFRLLAKTEWQRLFLSIVFVMTPFIPHMMAIQGTLMLEFFTLPFVLEALYQCLRQNKDKTFAAITILAAILIKQSHAVFVAPLLLVYLWSRWRDVSWRVLAALGVVAALFFGRLYLETGNPVSGLFNGVFRSPLYALSNFSNPLFGPKTWLETIMWPVIGQFSDRYGEGIVSRMAMIVFAPISIVPYVATLYLMIRRRSLAYVAILLGYLLWSHLVGYARYYLALNVMTLIYLIVEEGKTWSGKLNQRVVAVGLSLVAGLSLSSVKTDFSWRPNPSFATPGANRYYLGKYLEGLKLVGHDTLPRMAEEYSDLFAPYDAVLTVYRGPVTMLSYMGFLNGLPIYTTITPERYESIRTDSRVSETIKSTMMSVSDHGRVLMLVDDYFKPHVTAWYSDQYYRCLEIGPAPSDPYFQRSDYYASTTMYNCSKL